MRKDQNDEKRKKRKKGKNKRTSRCVGSGLGPSPKYLGRSEVTNIVSLLISCFLIAAVAVIRVDKVASISRSLPYWVSRTAGQVKAHVSPGGQDRRVRDVTDCVCTSSIHAPPAVVSRFSVLVCARRCERIASTPTARSDQFAK